MNDDRNEFLYGEQYYYGGESAPPVYHDDRSISEEELATFQQRDRLESRHHSWQQPYPSNHAAMFSPPNTFHASAPQFHTGRASDLDCHQSYPDQMSYHNSEAIMKEVDGVRADNVSSQTSHWPNSEQGSNMPMGVSSSSGAYMAPDTRSYAPDPGPAPMAAHSSGISRASSDRAHMRTNSTATASTLVAHLSSSIKSETCDNPFEPIPLGGEPKAKARPEESKPDSW